MAKVITGKVAQTEVTRRGIQFLQYTGAVRVTGSFFIRAGSVAIFRGYDLVKQWEDSIAGIRWVQLDGIESVVCTSSSTMLIASPYPVISVQIAPTAVVAPFSVTDVLGQGGWLASTIYQNGVMIAENSPWFANTGSLIPDAVGRLANVAQVNTALTRQVCLPEWGSAGGSASTAWNLFNAAATGVTTVLFGPADIKTSPWYNRAAIQTNVALGETLAILFFEIPTAAANFTTVALAPGTAVRSFFQLISNFRSGPVSADLLVRAQLFAPNWIPAVGNKVCTNVGHLRPAAVVGSNASQSVGFAQGMNNQPSFTTLPRSVAIQSSAPSGTP